MVIFVLKMINCLMWNIYLYFIILKLYTNFQNIIFLVKVVANASLNVFFYLLIYLFNVFPKTFWIMINFRWIINYLLKQLSFVFLQGQSRLFWIVTVLVIHLYSSVIFVRGPIGGDYTSIALFLSESISLSGFFIICLCCRWRSNFQYGEGWYPINLPLFCACPKSGPGFPKLYVLFFCVHWFEVWGGCLFCWYWWNCWPSLLLNFK